MEKHVVYSAVVIDKNYRGVINSVPVHRHTYGEHVTLHFYGQNGPTETPLAGKPVEMTLNRHYVDANGEAWTVDCDDPAVVTLKDVRQKLHVTVSCKDGIKPFYSNALISSGVPDDRKGFIVMGRIGYFMSDGTWVM